MNYKDAIAAMRLYFENYWKVAVVPAVPVAYDDKKFTKPTKKPWVRFTIQHADGFQASIGAPSSNFFRRRGIITAQIFCPEDDGSVEARKLADFVVEAYIGKDIPGFLYYDVTIVEVGNDNAGWYQINVKVNFEYDNIA